MHHQPDRDAQTQIRDVDVDEADVLANSGAVLLDVREQAEWVAGHLPVARHLPLADVESADLDDLAGRQVVAVCRSGNRSQLAAQILLDRGVDVSNLAGGMKAWAESGRPVVTDDGSPGEVA